MALQVWLPLTKDTRNQGLLTLPVPWDARSRDTGGKLGQYCYSDNAVYHIENEWLGNEWSLACWVKSLNWSQYNDIILCKNIASSTAAQFYLSIIGGTQLNIGCNAGSQTLTVNYTFATNTWYHVAATYSGTTLKLYLNGSEIGTKAYTSTQKTGMNNLGIGCRSSNDAGTRGTGGASKRMNDVRIYDHCLSEMEIKQLSQGLVLHYPLNRQGWGQENLAHNTYNLAPFSTSQVEFKAYDVGLLDVSNGEQITISFDLDMTVATGGTGYLQVYNTNYPGPHQITAGNALAGRTLVVGQDIHERISYTTTMITRSSSSYSTDRIEFYSNYSTENEIQISNIKIERGSIATPWCPNSSDALATAMGLNSNIEYDTSGYCNNGTRTGTFTWTSDTPKYAVSTKFNGTEQIAIEDITSEILTLSAWVKTSKNKSTSQFVVSDVSSQLCISFYSGTIIGYFGPAGSQSTGSKCTLGSAYVENDWNHIVVVKTGVGTRKVYCNGIEQNPTSNDYWTGNGSNFRIGARTASLSLPFYGEICDVRAYATALSADDVKSLYQNCATIDSDGTIRGQIRS